jgi:hypothetical protein
LAKTYDWIKAHRDYPHDEWCLIWPFSRDPRVGRGQMGDEEDQWAHRVMCREVHGPAPSPKHQTAHSCGNGHLGCVNPRHLSWKTNSENQLERYRVHGRGNPNANGNKSQFTPEQIAKMCSQYGEFTQTKLAEMYGCSLGTIQYYLKYRDARGYAGKIKHWSPLDDDTLKDLFQRGWKHKDIATVLDRSIAGVQMRAKRLGLASLTNGESSG